MLSVQRAGEVLRIEDGDRALEIRLRLRWEEDGGDTCWAPLDDTASQEGCGNELFASARRGPLHFELRCQQDGEFLLVEAAAQLDSDHPRALLLRELVWQTRRTGAWPVADVLRWWTQPYDVWGKPALLKLDESPEPSAVPHWRTAFIDPGTGRGLVWSTKLPADWRHACTIVDGQLQVETVIDAALVPGALWRGDAVAIALDVPAHAAMGGPARFHVARRRPWEVRTLGAWNSWDYYHLNVDREAIRENIDAICRHDFLRGFVRYVVVDDGWQNATGDWEPGNAFPDGMDDLAREIAAAGFLPGIWSAPFFAEPGCAIFDEHPEYCVQYQGHPFSRYRNIGCGPPWGDRHYLDPTRPQVVDHVYRLYRKLYDWGYRYFKTDFLSNPLLSGIGPHVPPRLGEGPLRFHAPEQGLMRAHRRCMQAVRAAIGEESFWLGCGSIWATGAGLMDASRMGADIAPEYPALLKCAASVLWNGHAHGRIWLNDPDFTVVRGPDTLRRAYHDAERPNCGKPPQKPQFSLGEARMWAALVILSGGMPVLSDRLAALNEEGLEVLRVVARLAGGPAGRALDTTDPRPRVVLKEECNRLALGLFNWEDDAQPALPASCAALIPDREWMDAWSGRRVRTGRLLDAALPGHSCLLLTTNG